MSVFVLVGVGEAVELGAQPLLFDVGVPGFAGGILGPGLLVDEPLKPRGLEKLFPRPGELGVTPLRHRLNRFQLSQKRIL